MNINALAQVNFSSGETLSSTSSKVCGEFAITLRKVSTTNILCGKNDNIMSEGVFNQSFREDKRHVR